ncbi:MAG TPA: AI-2E family transporter [Allosphingosinicella sp.]|jgi:predicted PurR-regulated permease PerM
MEGDGQLPRGPIAPAPRSGPSWLGFVVAAAAAVAMLWFLQKILTALLLLFLVLVVGIALSAPINWLARRGLPRRFAKAVVLLLFLASLVLVGWLVIPRVAAQLVVLVERLPDLLLRLNAQIVDLLDRNPELQRLVASSGGIPDFSPAALGLFQGVGNLSLGLLGGVALAIIFLSGVISVVQRPRPIVRAYIASLPIRHRSAGVRAYRRAARAVIGWAKASVIIGTIEFVAVFLFLTYLEVPGALVWAALAFFVEFIPRIGNYLMAIPPVLVSLTLGPLTAVYVALFYFVMSEFIGAFVSPRIGGAAMAVHPLLLLFFALAFALGFGLLGALVATPAAAFFAAYYSEFYMKRHREQVI